MSKAPHMHELLLLLLQVWVTCLAKAAPMFLARVAVQSTVVLLPCLDEEGAEVQAVAVAVLEDLVVSV